MAEANIRIEREGNLGIVTNTGSDLDLDSGCRYESEVFGSCFGTDDRREGMRAFLDKRKASFAGK